MELKIEQLCKDIKQVDSRSNTFDTYTGDSCIRS